ncbi:MAG: ribonuclease III [Acidiferrobacterales bacterium]|nr:ribonuclease III [Acidiferrobacterales bacterium]
MSLFYKSDELQNRIGYLFEDLDLLKLALTHRSRGSKNYERLEFLGDSILGFVVADWLYHNYQDLAEGKLSRMRSSLVRKETLALVARELKLSDHLILGEGELKSGGFNRDSILADTVESIIGALYLDSGFETAHTFIHDKFAPHFQQITPDSTYKDPKSRLQEAMQKKGMDLPVYEIVATKGAQHDQEFTVECRLNQLSIASRSTARSRRAAEQAAAADALDLFKDQLNQRRKSAS